MSMTISCSILPFDLNVSGKHAFIMDDVCFIDASVILFPYRIQLDGLSDICKIRDSCSIRIICPDCIRSLCPYGA